MRNACFFFLFLLVGYNYQMIEAVVYSFTSMPVWYQVVTVAVLGGIMGSFLNVVVYRMHTGASLSGRSRCFSCGETLTPRELIPFFSWIVQKGRCRYCSARIPVRDFLMEIGMGIMFVWVYLTATGIFGLFFSLAFVSVSVLIFVYDLVHMIIPDEMVLLLILLAAVFLGYEVWQNDAFSIILPHLYAALLATSILGLLWLVSKGRWMGLGDVKLVFPLALLLDVTQAFSLVIISFWIGALIGIVLLLYPRVVYLYRRYTLGAIAKTTRYFTMKSEIPFAPFILVAFWLVYLYEINIFTLLY